MRGATAVAILPPMPIDASSAALVRCGFKRGAAAWPENSTVASRNRQKTLAVANWLRTAEKRTRLLLRKLAAIRHNCGRFDAVFTRWRQMPEPFLLACGHVSSEVSLGTWAGRCACIFRPPLC